MKKWIALAVVVVLAIVAYNRNRLYVRDPLGSLTRNDVKEAGAKDAVKKLAGLAQLFDASVFESTAKLLSKSAKSGDDVPARRAAKEAALLEVRRFERLIAEHALLKKAIDNPFHPVAVKPLISSLRQLNGALLAS